MKRDLAHLRKKEDVIPLAERLAMREILEKQKRRVGLFRPDCLMVFGIWPTVEAWNKRTPECGSPTT